MIDYQKYYQKIILTLESAAKKYQEYFVEKDYLIFSPAFKEQPYYEVKARPENFLHLTGLKVNTDPYIFYKKCLGDGLNIVDLNTKAIQESNNLNQIIKSKLTVIKDAFEVFSFETTKAEENFTKNVVSCTVAVEGKTFTLGFTLRGDCLIPMSLLKGNHLNQNKMGNLDLVLTKNRTSSMYNKILVGNINILRKYLSHETIRNKIGDKLLSELKKS